jgi:predicted O-methyltransferase YrrM
MLVTNFHLKRFLYTVMCGFRQLRDVAEIHPARALALRALERTADFIERDMPNALAMEKQADVLRYALSQVTLDGAFLEFGVFNGGTARLGARAFDRQGRLPRVPSNVTLHKGWFSDTIPKWKADHPGRLAFVHIDCDIYSSTKSILDLLADRIEPGTVIVFDDYFNFPNWENHEHKAFCEYLVANRVAYEPLAYARQQIAVKMVSASGPA